MLRNPFQRQVIYSAVLILSSCRLEEPPRGNPTRLPDLSTVTASARFIDTNAADNPEAITLDTDLNLIVVGRTTGVITGATAGYSDYFIRKYDSSGSVLWTKQVGSTSNDGAYAVAADEAGQVYVGGFVEGALPSSTGAYSGGGDYFVEKYDENGTLQYRVISGTASSERVHQVMVSDTGDLYAFGRTGGALHGETNQGSDDCFLVKYDPSGNRVWTKLFGTATQDACFTASRILNSTDLYLAFSTASSYGTGTNQGGTDIVVLRVDSSGNVVWSKMIGGSRDEAVYGSNVDALGNYYITGPTKSDLSITNPTPTSDDAYVAKITHQGTVSWITQLGSTTVDEGGGVGLTQAGGVYITGFSNGTLHNVPATGGYSPFLANFKADGTFQSLHYTGGSGTETGRKIAVYPNGSRVYIAGACSSADGSFYSTPCVATAAHILQFDF